MVKPWAAFEQTGRGRNDVSNSSMGLFIAVLANIFFQFGTNHLALFLFIIFTSNLSIYDKVSCACERIGANNTKLTNEIRKLATMFVLGLLRKINSQVKLKLFIVTKPTLHRTIWFAWTQLLLSMSMLFYLLSDSLYRYFMQMLMRRKKMTRMHMKMMLTNHDMTMILKVMATKVLRVKTFAIGKISNQVSSWCFKLAIFTTTLTAMKSKSSSGSHMPENRSNLWSSTITTAVLK